MMMMMMMMMMTKVAGGRAVPAVVAGWLAGWLPLGPLSRLPGCWPGSVSLLSKMQAVFGALPWLLGCQPWGLMMMMMMLMIVDVLATKVPGWRATPAVLAGWPAGWLPLGALSRLPGCWPGSVAVLPQMLAMGMAVVMAEGWRYLLQSIP
jgi:hypothetical protein